MSPRYTLRSFGQKKYIKNIIAIYVRVQGLFLIVFKNKSITYLLFLGTGSSQDGEEDMWGLWGQVVNEWENYSKKKNTYLKELVRKGVPHHFRGIVWQLLCGANDSPIRKQYPEYIKATSACEKVLH